MIRGLSSTPNTQCPISCEAKPTPHSLEWSFICSDHTTHMLHITLCMLSFVDYRDCSSECGFSLFVLSLQKPFVPRNTHSEFPMIMYVFA